MAWITYRPHLQDDDTGRVSALVTPRESASRQGDELTGQRRGAARAQCHAGNAAESDLAQVREPKIVFTTADTSAPASVKR